MYKLLIELPLLFCVMLPVIETRSRCVKVVGRIHCSTDWDRHFDVSIWLMDKDREFLDPTVLCGSNVFSALPWESDDKMGHTRSNEDGNFIIQGCAEDFGYVVSPS